MLLNKKINKEEISNPNPVWSRFSTHVL